MKCQIIPDIIPTLTECQVASAEFQTAIYATFEAQMANKREQNVSLPFAFSRVSGRWTIRITKSKFGKDPKIMAIMES